MMNKTKVEFCDFTFNLVTGCRAGCDNCYAAKQAKRFAGDIRLKKGSDQLQEDEDGLYILEKPFKNITIGKLIQFPVGFEPTLHKYRLPRLARRRNQRTS